MAAAVLNEWHNRAGGRERFRPGNRLTGPTPLPPNQVEQSVSFLFALTHGIRTHNLKDQSKTLKIKLL